MSITQKELKELFLYNKQTGQLKRKQSVSGCNKNYNRVLNPVKGYYRICIKGKSYLMHRLIWLYHHGKFPKNYLDHINCDRSDNRIENLREVSYVENSINVPNRSNNITGVVGVSLHRASNKWQARISKNKKNIALGIFSSFDEAVKVRYEAEKHYGYHLLNNQSSAEKYLKENNLL